MNNPLQFDSWQIECPSEETGNNQLKMKFQIAS